MNTFISLIILSAVSFCLNAKTIITSISFNKERDVGKIIVHLKRPMVSNPELVIKGKIIQVVVPNASVWPKIQKRISLNKNLDAQILAYQYEKNIARVRAVLPYNVNNVASKINLVEKKQAIEIIFPIISSDQKNTLALKSQFPNKDSYDESYLERLLNDKQTLPLKEEKTPLNQNKEKNDVVSMKMSGQAKSPQFSLLPYLGKAALFLGLILFGLFSVVYLLKKGIFNKGKLGFLSSTNVVQVLHKTYIAPKRSIMTIKAYDQILLIGVDEKGMHFLTEIKNPMGFLKDGERQIAGDSFDTNVDDADQKDKNFNIKEILDKPAKSNKKSIIDFLGNQKEKRTVKFSEKIKNKVKDLKSLQ